MKRSFLSILLCVATSSAYSLADTKPNLLIIQTDEHNFRTLGCYRDLMSEDQGFMWGKGVSVDTPNLDRIADEGAICTSFYASSPVCTPSRASFVSGLYPVSTGSPRNDMPMYDEIITFASVLKDEGYATAYVGKWHLDGPAKPGFEPARKFGFTDNRYMMNRGHWKGLGHEHGKPIVIGINDDHNTQKFNVTTATEENFTTDYLTTRALEIMERDKEQPFCVMLAIPDPHGPNKVRPPYDTMFDHLKFSKPRTMEVPLEDTPLWSRNRIESKLDQDKMQDYFGMVKCIDDNIGRLLKFLEDNELDKNTIVVFTSDHGDLMGEHKRHNKGVPYEASAKIPFLIRWPAQIAAGKIINAPYNTSDFPPTILGIMGAPAIPGAHGINAKDAFLSQDMVIDSKSLTYITGTSGNWTAAIGDRFKYVLSHLDTPWLFDLEKDPDELINFANNPEYAPTAKAMEKFLKEQIHLRKDPALKNKILYLGDPAPSGSKKKKIK